LDDNDETVINEEADKLSNEIKTVDGYLTDSLNVTMEYMNKADLNKDHKLSKREVYFMLKDLGKKWKMDLIGSKLEMIKLFN
jgi:hypothetical protein